MALTTESALAKDKRTGKSAMQHRHFATVATIIESMRTHPVGWDSDLIDDVSMHFADELEETNPKFDRIRFLAACGVGS